MPELPEATTSGKLPRLFVATQPDSCRIVKTIQADATQAEMPAHPAGSRASNGHVYVLESSSKALRGCTNAQTPLYPPLYSTTQKEPPVPISTHGLVLVDAETHPRNVLLKFLDNKGRVYWCQIQLLKHTVSQIFNKCDWEEAICVVDSASRGFKVAIAFEFKDHVLAFLTLDLLVQFYWSEDRTQMPAQQPDVYLEFPRFLDDLVAWITQRRTIQSNRAGNAMTLVRGTTEIFAGAGVYTISELWHMAGLSPNLTEAEVFDSPSRTARLCAAFYHFGKEAHTTLWPLVQRFLQDYVICVRPEHRLLYSERLHVWGKDRSYVTERFHDLMTRFEAACAERSTDDVWIREFTPSDGPFDVFEPDLVRHALEHEQLNLGSLIFGSELWTTLHASAHLPVACLADENALSRFFRTTPTAVPGNMSPSWLDPSAYSYLFHLDSKASRAHHPRTHLYRASNADIWSVIPAYPNNSAPIFRPRPSRSSTSTKSKSKLSLASAPEVTPMLEGDAETREKALLTYKIRYTQEFTVGPLDYCGIARRIKGRGQDIIFYCKGDPRALKFYHRRLALAEVTAKLKVRGEEKQGLSPKVLAGVEKKVARIPAAALTATSNKENVEGDKPNPKKRRSADRGLALSGLVLSPRKRRRLSS
ncbi:hypothetical protein B0H15DRAFT_927592 [Mycena belliarum]|uniref:Uncharacterized protein n=1 Tax=Mycena belliarum TaxID=1033014 RepID=A0AAD6UKJ4_9AGAR|nr:hypothetical protein B0H15DRAFT_927592 [Mycena belliae]